MRDTTGWQGELPVDRVVGIVGKTPILWSDVLIAVQARLRGQRPAMDAGQQRQFALDALNQLLNDEVFVQKAKTDTTIKVTDADVNDQVDQALKRVRDQFRSENIACIDEHNPYFRMIRNTWGQKLREVFEGIEHPQWNGGEAAHPLCVPGHRFEPMRKITHPGEKIV